MSELSSTEREIVRTATRRVNRRVGFAWHAAAFALVIPLLIVINLQTSPQYLWFFWPLGGWGLGLLVHAFAAFIGGPSSDSMVEREVAREMARRGLK